MSSVPTDPLPNDDRDTQYFIVGDDALLDYLALQNSTLDAEDDQLNLIPGDWRNGVQMQDVLNIIGENRATRATMAGSRENTEAVLQLTYQSCPMPTGWYIK